MRKTAKIATLCMAFTMSAAMVLSTAACQSTEELVKDGKTINVKLHSAGYGTSYIYALKEKFEEAYKEEGYKMNIFTPRAGFQGEKFLQDIAADTGADVYFGGGVDEELLSDPAYANTIADITELVYNKKPINFKGEEVGDKTVGELMSEMTYGYHSYQRADGSYYSIPWGSGIRGVAVNTAVMKEYNLELPKTSKEFFHCYDVIMAKAAETGVFPITHIATTNNYPCSFTNGWMAQYEGYEWYEEFCTFQKADGTKLTKDEATAMFNSDGVYYMLEGMYHALDPNCATYGSASQGVEKAQAKLMNGSCAFMMNGDWLLSETYSQYSDDYRKNISFIRVPVISELGVKLFGAGTAYNKSEEDCEKILRAIVDGADENKEVSVIKAEVDAKLSVDIAEADVQRVAEARGYTYTESNDSGIYISARSEVKDIAALLVRMCASEDGGNLISSNTYSCNPFAGNYEEHRYGFVNATRAIQANRYFKGLRPTFDGYRATIDVNFLDIFPYTGLYVNLKIAAQKISMYNAETLVKLATEQVYKDAAASMQGNIYNDVRDNYNNKW